MMQAAVCKVCEISVFFQIPFHQGDCPGFTVKWPMVHDLNAQTFLNGQKLRGRAVQPFLLDAVWTAQSKFSLVTKSGRRMTEIQ